MRVPQSLGGGYEPELGDTHDSCRAVGRAQGRGSHSDARAGQRGLGSMSIPAFDGFRRSDGSVGVRNHMLIMSVTGLTGPTARRIGRAIPGARVVTTPFGSGLIGEDAELQKRALTAFGRHPNVGAALVIGGTPPFVESIAQAITASGKPTDALVLDDCDHDAITLTERGTRIAARMMREISGARRTRI